MLRSVSNSIQTGISVITIVLRNPPNYPLWREIIGLSEQGTSGRLSLHTFPTHVALSRRICPGMLVAEREIFLAVSRLLWSFNILPVEDEPISLEEYEGNSGRTPLPFRIRLIPRHANIRSVLDAEDEVIT